tara:strand:- start:100 stop:579 length:480 start_codon:yes stop_codon:yes gene_type:complete
VKLFFINQFVLFFMCFVLIDQVAAIDFYSFKDETMRERYLYLVKELRCPKCQNQNIADSNSPISIDLRQQVYTQLEAGNSDQQIINYMVERYGQFIIYRPSVEGKTLVLWFAPLAFIIIGFICVVFVARRPVDRDFADMKNTQRSQRLNELLNEEEQRK